MQRPGRVFAQLAVLGVLAGCGADTPRPGITETSSIAPAQSNAATLVRYELTGSAVTIDGTYAEPANGVENMVVLRSTALPWDKNFILPPGQLFVAGLVAHGPNLESKITCKIIMNGAVVAQQTGSTVDCRAEVS